MNERERQLQKYYEDGPVGPTGIGGWLILLLIGRFLSIIAEIMAINNLISLYSHLHLTNTGVTIYTIAGILALIHIGIELSIIILIFLKRMFFRIMIVILIAFYAFCTIIYPILVANILGTTFTLNPTTLTFFIVAIPWIIYIFISKRVRNTFHSQPKKPKSREDNPGFSNPSGG